MMTVEAQNVVLIMVAILLFIGAKRIPELMISHAEKKKKVNDGLLNRQKSHLF